METIYIPQLLTLPDKTEEIRLQEWIPELKTLTPVRGRLLVRHGGSFLEVSVQAEAIVTLTCDRCLEQYNHRLLLDTSEIIWLDKDAEQVDELPPENSLDELSESLPPKGYFQPDVWLYEQLSLAMPLRQLCGKDCQQPEAEDNDNPLVDNRWARLAALKQQLSQ